MTVMLNEELAAEAARRALADRGLDPRAVRMLATGTTQGDLLVPGFASMVHGRLGGGPMEVLSAAGVCASGMAALKAAVSAVRLGEHPVALAVGSELVSRSLGRCVPDDAPDTSFLRWTQRRCPRNGVRARAGLRIRPGPAVRDPRCDRGSVGRYSRSEKFF